ncbi:hypothetical protein [Amycolatopsis tolypomycina]|uniref:hypothetical protein n=1 Tax=Amycolatopsis tolypomycina TaxID=208445 RepID=UPI0033BEEE32
MTGPMPPWVHLARRALSRSAANDLRSAALVTQRMFDTYGESCLLPAILFWIDTALAAQHPGYRPGKHGVELLFQAEGTGEQTGADEVQPEVAWAGRLFSARAADDRDMFNALLGSLPVAEHGRHVAVLLSMAGATLRTMGWGEPR